MISKVSVRSTISLSKTYQLIIREASHIDIVHEKRHMDVRHALFSILISQALRLSAVYKSTKVHLGQSQEVMMSIHIYWKCKYTYENAGFCIPCVDDLSNYRNFPRFFTENVTGSNPPPPPRPYDVSRGQNRHVTLP